MTASTSWTPTLRNGIYCSLMCGGVDGYCTLAMYKQAQRTANRVAKELGEGWEPEVYENLGWHWRAVLKFGSSQIAVVYGKPGSYLAGLCDAKIFPALKMTGDYKRNARAARSSLARKIRAQAIIMDEALKALTEGRDA